MARQAVWEVRRGLVCVKVAERRRGSRQFTLRVERLYRDGDIWKKSSRFTRNDIPLLRLALDEAYSWILFQEPGDAQNCKRE